MKLIGVEVTKAPAVRVVTKEEYIAHARINAITAEQQGEALDRRIDAATRGCEEFMRRALIKQEITASYLPDGQSCECGSLLRLPRGKVLSIISVTPTGEEALPPDGYEWNNGIVLKLTTPSALPLVVVFEAGYGEAAEAVPALIRESILDYATVLYEDREGKRVDTRGVPIGIRAQLLPFQVPVL